MRRPQARRILRGVNIPAVMAVALLAGGVWTGAGESWAVRAGSQETEALRIDVTLDEYSFSPDPLRMPAGRPVTLVIRNVGRFAHEFMAGREVEGNDFTLDLFADLHVNIEQAEKDDAEHAEHAETADHAEDEHEHGSAELAHGAAAAEHDDAQAAHAHGGGHEHGTMVETQAGETFLMTFTLPEDRRGEWATGCFLPGHYEAGMHGTLIVE